MRTRPFPPTTPTWLGHHDGAARASGAVGAGHAFGLARGSRLRQGLQRGKDVMMGNISGSTRVAALRGTSAHARVCSWCYCYFYCCCCCCCCYRRRPKCPALQTHARFAYLCSSPTAQAHPALSRPHLHDVHVVRAVHAPLRRPRVPPHRELPGRAGGTRHPGGPAPRLPRPTQVQRLARRAWLHLHCYLQAGDLGERVVHSGWVCLVAMAIV